MWKIEIVEQSDRSIKLKFILAGCSKKNALKKLQSKILLKKKLTRIILPFTFDVKLNLICFKLVMLKWSYLIHCQHFYDRGKIKAEL